MNPVKIQIPGNWEQISNIESTRANQIRTLPLRNIFGEHMIEIPPDWKIGNTKIIAHNPGKTQAICEHTEIRNQTGTGNLEIGSITYSLVLTFFIETRQYRTTQQIAEMMGVPRKKIYASLQTLYRRKFLTKKRKGQETQWRLR